MASEFMRLYKCIILDDEKKPNVTSAKLGLEVTHIDTSHEYERRTILHKLGYQVGIKDPKRLERNWHHGKAAREKVENKAHGIETKGGPPVDYKEWKRDYQMKLIEINHLTARDRAMGEAVKQQKHIPATLWNKYGIRRDDDDDDDRRRSKGKEGGSSRAKRVGQLPPLASDAHVPYGGKPLVYLPVHDPVDFPMYRDTTLKNASHQWTDQEKKCINDLYWDINRPQTESPAAWDVYYQIFVARFLQSFPHRDVYEVKRKIMSMLTKRQIKMPGEVEYWANVKSTSGPAAAAKARVMDRLAAAAASASGSGEKGGHVAVVGAKGTKAVQALRAAAAALTPAAEGGGGDAALAPAPASVLRRSSSQPAQQQHQPRHSQQQQPPHSAQPKPQSPVVRFSEPV
jgi:hypothetical protein